MNQLARTMVQGTPDFCNAALRPLRARLAAARQQDDVLQPLLAGETAELRDRITGALDREIGLVGDIGLGDTVQRGRPRLDLVQSNGIVVERETGRVAMPRAFSRALTRAPVFPSPPMMRIGSSDMGYPFCTKHENISYLQKAINSRIVASSAFM